MTVRADWTRAEDRPELVRRAADHLAAGELVVFPTETVYALAASPISEKAIEKLLAVKGRNADKPVTLALAHPSDSLSYVPEMTDEGRRLAQRCWPGPVTLVFPEPSGAGPLSRLPDVVRRTVLAEGGVGLRVPDHAAILETMRILDGPLILTSANVSGSAEPIEPEGPLRELGDQIALLIDDRATRYGRPSTVVRVSEAGLEILREGVVSANRLQRLAGEFLVFVCTGNSCRSPMAEAIYKQMLADALRCDVDELPDRGVSVMSAGIAAYPGEPASSGARLAVRDFGASLEEHSAQPLTRELAALADRLLVMTNEHRRILTSTWPRLASKTRLLGGDQEVIDPIGESDERYRECAAQIARYLRPLAAETVDKLGGRGKN